MRLVVCGLLCFPSAFLPAIASAAEAPVEIVACQVSSGALSLRAELEADVGLKNAEVSLGDKSVSVPEMRRQSEAGGSGAAGLYRHAGAGFFLPLLDLSFPEALRTGTQVGSAKYRFNNDSSLIEESITCEVGFETPPPGSAPAALEVFSIFSWTGDHSRPTAVAKEARELLKASGCRVQEVKCETVTIPAILPFWNERSDCTVAAENCIGADLGPEGASCRDGRLAGGHDTILEYALNKLMDLREFSNFCVVRDHT
jgi:hypothetical protein